jgi:superfamily II DNA or RNA helicase
MVNFTVEKNNQQGSLQTDLLSLIRENFSVANPSFNRFSANRFIPKRLYSITPAGKFDIGLYGEIKTYLKSENILYTENNYLNILFQPKIVNCIIQPLKFNLRNYQEASVQAALENGRGVIILPTAAGKTLTIASLIAAIHSFYKTYKILIIVPNIQLIKQTYTDFIEYGIEEENISKWSGDDIPNLNCNIVIAGTQILQSQFKEHKEFLQSINVLIIDECHKVRKGNAINDIIKIINTPHKFGFTGTMPPDKVDQWNIIGKLGPILYEEKSYNLRDSKQIASAIIHILAFNYINNPQLSRASSSSPTKAYEEELDFIINSTSRNNKISKICQTTDKNTLIMVERINHGELLYNILKEQCVEKQIYFIQGSVDVEVREEVRTLMEQQNNVVCVAISKVFAEGINIKNLHYIIFAASRKAKIKILQSIGRGLRLHPEKKLLVIFDIADNLRYGNKHLKERIKLYDSEKIQYKTTEVQIS